jgi:hypothetical protein
MHTALDCLARRNGPGLLDRRPHELGEDKQHVQERLPCWSRVVQLRLGDRSEGGVVLAELSQGGDGAQQASCEAVGLVDDDSG